MEKIWLDTDIGTDIDDGYAFAYLLGRKDCEIVGISTVTQDTVSRAKLARIFCERCGEDVPVYAGSRTRFCDDVQPNGIGFESIEATLMYKTQYEINQHEVPTGTRNFKEIQPKSAVAIDAMKDAIVNNPNEITLIAIGPLTNVAKLFSIYPETKKLLKRIVVMGGRYTEDPDFKTERWGVNEWNIVCDKYAAKIVLESEVSEGYILGIETTVDYFKENADCYAMIEKYEQLKPLQFMTRQKGIKYQPNPHPIWFHDPLACALAFAPENFEQRRGNVKVDVDRPKDIPEWQRGKTIFEEDKNGGWIVAGHYIGKQDAFFKHYIETLENGIK